MQFRVIAELQHPAEVRKGERVAEVASLPILIARRGIVFRRIDGKQVATFRVAERASEPEQIDRFVLLAERSARGGK